VLPGYRRSLRHDADDVAVVQDRQCRQPEPGRRLWLCAQQPGRADPADDLRRAGPLLSHRRPHHRLAAFEWGAAGICCRQFLFWSVRMKSWKKAALLPGLLLTGGASAQEVPKPPPPLMVWAAQPVPETPYKAPNRPIWKLDDILAAHKGQ